jgi:putative chitinase
MEEQIDEALPKWTKAAGAAGALGATALGGYSAMQPQTPPTSQSNVVTLELPKIKAKSEKVNEMLAAFNTAAGKMLVGVARGSGSKGRELAQFLAQCAHESLNFSQMRELGGSLDFKKYDIKHNPEKAKQLGNTHSGDGQRYIGRGFIQLTGRENYRKAGHALGLPLEQHPKILEKPEVAAKVSVWYWKHRVSPKIDNFDNTQAATKPINSALRGIRDRHDRYVATLQILGILNKNS